MLERRVAGDLLRLLPAHFVLRTGGNDLLVTRRRHFAVDAFVLPGGLVVHGGLAVPAAEHAVEVLGVAEVLAQDGGRVRIRDHVLLEGAIVLQDVVHDPAQEGNVRPGAYGDVDVRHRARPREARIDVDDGRAPRLRFHHPLETDRMALGHVRALDDDDVGVLQILLERRRAASTERDPQTGDRGAVSDPGLVLDLQDPQRRVELLEEVVLLVVEGRAAEVGDAERPLDRLSLVVPRFPGLVAGLLHALGDHLHRLLERDDFPFRPARPPVQALVDAMRAGDELEGGGALRTEAATRNGRVFVTLDVEDAPILDEDLLSATDGAVRTNALDRLVRALRAGAQRHAPFRERRPVERRGIAPGDLTSDRPAAKHLEEAHAALQPRPVRTLGTQRPRANWSATAGRRYFAAKRSRRSRRRGLRLRRAEAAGRSIRWRPSARALATEAEGEAGARAHRDVESARERLSIVEYRLERAIHVCDGSGQVRRDAGDLHGAGDGVRRAVPPAVIDEAESETRELRTRREESRTSDQVRADLRGGLEEPLLRLDAEPDGDEPRVVDDARLHQRADIRRRLQDHHGHHAAEQIALGWQEQAVRNVDRLAPVGSVDLVPVLASATDERDERRRRSTDSHERT